MEQIVNMCQGDGYLDTFKILDFIKKYIYNFFIKEGDLHATN